MFVCAFMVYMLSCMYVRACDFLFTHLHVYRCVGFTVCVCVYLIVCESVCIVCK